MSTFKSELAVSIDGFLDYHDFVFSPKGAQQPHWIVVSYLCRLRKGTVDVGERRKFDELRFFSPDELFAWPPAGDREEDACGERRAALSPWTVHVREVYRERYGNRPFWEGST